MLDIYIGPIVYAQAPEINGGTRRNIQSLLGAGLVITGILVITKERHFPGWWALLPTIGTVLIISAGLQAWLNRTILASRLLVWIGLISFPLYLWHWLLLSFARIIDSEKPTQSIRIAAIILSIVLAWLTYQFIEKPIRLGNPSDSKTKTIILFILLIVAGYAGYHCYKNDGLAFRLKERQEYSAYFENSLPEHQYFKSIALSEKWRSECDFYDGDKYLQGKATIIPMSAIDKNCYERNASYDHALFVWGDSHAMQLYYGLKNHLPPNWQILQVASSGCPPNISTESSITNYCTQSNWFALKTIKETKPDVVIIAENLGHNIDKFNQITEKLKTLGVKKIIFTGPTPHWTEALPKIILRKLWINTPKRTYKSIDKKVLADDLMLQQQFKQNDTAIFVSLINYFCNKDGCLTYINTNKKTEITTWDYGHLTPIASDYLAKTILAKLVIEDTLSKQ